jgi:hypothetical protein
MSDDLWLAVIQVFGSILTILVTVLVPLILNMLRKKYGLEIKAAEDAQIEHAALEAVRIVKELSAAKVKANRGPMTPQEKFSTSVSTVIEAVPSVVRETAERKVIAALSKAGEGSAANPQPAPGS